MTWWPGGRQHAYAARAPAATRSAAVSAASTAPRAASHVPGPIERHRVVGEVARARPGGRGRSRSRAEQPCVREDVRDDAALAGVVAAGPRRPTLPRADRGRRRAPRSWTASSASSSCGSAATTRAPAPPSAARIASARAGTSSPGVATPTQTSAPGSWSGGARSQTIGIASHARPTSMVGRWTPTSLRDHGLAASAIRRRRRAAQRDHRRRRRRVGHATVWRDEPAGRGIARTGVTAILPGRAETCSAAGARGRRGAQRRGRADRLAPDPRVGPPRDAGLSHLDARRGPRAPTPPSRSQSMAADPRVGADDVVIPVVGECDDSWLNDARSVHVEAERRRTAAVATGRHRFERGRRRRRAPGCPASASRAASARRAASCRSSTPRVGVLAADELRRPQPADRRRAGRPPARARSRRRTTPELHRRPRDRRAALPHQLERIARRAGLGLARTGSVAYHGSGEIFVAFATGDERSVGDDELNPLFEAAVDATEEAVVNSLWAAQDVTGRDGHVVEALRTRRRSSCWLRRAGCPDAAGSGRRTSAGRARCRGGRAARACG